MSKIHIERSHSLSTEQAREKVDRIAEDLADHYDVEYAWQDETLGFERSGVHGSIRVEPASLVVDVKLGFMAAMFKQAIEHSIEKKLDELLA